MKRREALTLAAGGLGLAAGCRKKEENPPPMPGESRSVEGPASEAPEGWDLEPVRVERARQIRTVVGLRPFRPAGFVVRREERGEKVLIHNYGHGGGGMSLSWGSAHLACREAGDLAGRSCAVVGGGVMGLSTARLLQQRGAQVTLYTRALPPETTSNIAGAQWWPVSVFDGSRRSESFGRQFVEAAHFAHRYFQNLVGPQWGVRWLPNYYLSNRAPANGWIDGPGGVLHDLQVGFRDFAPGEHLFPSAYVRRFHSMLIEPATYLARLLAEVQGTGARVVVRDFTSADEVLALPEALIFNCTGLGAGPLFGDGELMPIRGQLCVLLPQQEVNYNLISGLHYMFPRADGVILGGTYDRGRQDLPPDSGDSDRILAGHEAIFRQFGENLAAYRRQLG
ncbi:FAD-dependent oxidoreductase [Roseibacillus ishigakijimensis]|uniref:D-amino-acid oxidase n=1 Tax=Roseibacillus ishigakijimensis TaxID=454146 RepID=A0A934VJQ5_9BACT|nr:FAD-dependent oxidoreductase [Roseibacillus ishigakijimensis]MBK1832849.1 FAD-dependent oxidoreductase [Roseibacillus ishigakijimensis]